MIPRFRLGLLSILFLVSYTGFAECKLWNVGPTRAYTLPSQVAGLVADGDTIDVDAGTYDDAATWYANNILLRGRGGYAHLENAVSGDKGIVVLQGSNVTVENMELSGAAISSDLGSNAAGIRAQGGSFTVRHCYIHHNQMGVLCSLMPRANVLIEYSVLAYNASADQSLFAHNIYINTCDAFTLQFCYVHGAEVGHNVKSRAKKNFILYNRIMDESDSASRQIDLPNGGQAVVMGNEIEKGPNAPNTNTLAFGLEGLINPGPQNLYVVNNTLVNDLPARGIYIEVPGTGLDTLEVTNNIFAGTGVLLSGSPAVIDSATNLYTANIAFVGLLDPSGYDYHLTVGSPAISAGSGAGFADGFPLNPVYEYVDTANGRTRPVLNRETDLGAFEFGSSSGVERRTSNAFGIAITQDQTRQVAKVYLSKLPIVRTEIIVSDLLGR
jgi:hypothetical protein